MIRPYVGKSRPRNRCGNRQYDAALGPALGLIGPPTSIPHISIRSKDSKSVVPTCTLRPRCHGRSSFPAGQSFDTIICLNVVEHLADDHRSLAQHLERARRRRSRHHAGAQWPETFRHARRSIGPLPPLYRRAALASRQAAGFKSGKLLKFNRPGVVAWWLNGQILRRTTFGLGQIRLLNFLTPLFRLIDPWLPFPPLSLIAIFREADCAGLGAPSGPQFARSNRES